MVITICLLNMFGTLRDAHCVVISTASSGEYVPVLVDHSDDLPCRGQYFLHHGLQRRIRITVVHDTSPDLRWKDVRELVVGRIR